MLDIHICFKKGILFVKLDGVLDGTTTNKLYQEVTSLVSENRIRNLVFNVSNLNLIDEKGIKSLMQNYYISSKNEGHSLLCGINNNIKNKIENSSLLKYMLKTDNELDAIRLLEG